MRKSNLRSLQVLSFLALLYLLFVFLFEFPFISISTAGGGRSGGSSGGAAMNSREEHVLSPVRPNRFLKSSSSSSAPSNLHGRKSPTLSGLRFAEFESANANFSELHKAEKEAWTSGTKLLSEFRNPPPTVPETRNKTKETCPQSISLSGADFNKGKVMVIPCGLTLGSHLTLVGRAHAAHPEHDPKITVGGEEPTMVSQFMMELQGLRAVDLCSDFNKRRKKKP